MQVWVKAVGETFLDYSVCKMWKQMIQCFSNQSTTISNARSACSNNRGRIGSCLCNSDYECYANTNGEIKLGLYTPPPRGIIHALLIFHTTCLTMLVLDLNLCDISDSTTVSLTTFILKQFVALYNSFYLMHFPS